MKLVKASYIEGCDGLTHLPCGFGKLTSIHKLDKCILADDNDLSAQIGRLHEPPVKV